MSSLVTLRGLSGLSQVPKKLADSALVMIDIQETYRSGIMRLEGAESAIEDASKLLQRARNAGIPVFHVRHDAGPGTPYDVSAALGQICSEVAPSGNEPVLTKSFPSSFVGTDLQVKLEAAGVKDVILTGFMTHMCVNSTARSAFSLGFRPTVVASATATRDLPGPDGSTIAAHVLQAASLASLSDLFAIVVQMQDEIPD